MHAQLGWSRFFPSVAWTPQCYEHHWDSALFLDFDQFDHFAGFAGFADFAGPVELLVELEPEEEKQEVVEEEVEVEVWRQQWEMEWMERLAAQQRTSRK